MAVPSAVLVILSMEFTYYLLIDRVTGTEYLFVNENLTESEAKDVYVAVFQKIKESVPASERETLDL